MILFSNRSDQHYQVPWYVYQFLMTVAIFRKFYIQEKIKTGIVNDTDFTKQNLYAACLQYHKEHPWAQEASCKIYAQIDDANFVK